VYSLVVHEDAEDDLEGLWKNDAQAAARISVLLEELEGGDQDLLDALTVHDYGAYRSKDYHVSKISKYWDKGIDLWRLKIWELEDLRLRYRIIYAYKPGAQRYYVLGILPREHSYDSSDPRVQRVLQAYNDIF
jgi:mRNA-degrading endonuclease RelE of RelBE toxin-antitoxin system